MREIIGFALAFVLSYAFTPWVIRFAHKFSLLTDKKKRKHPAHTHKGIIPRAGGLGIFLAVLIVSFLFIPLNKIFISIHIASFILLVIGLLDDKYDLSAYLRFFLNILASAIAVAGGIGIPYISNPFGEGVIDLRSFSFKFNFFSRIKLINCIH